MKWRNGRFMIPYARRLETQAGVLRSDGDTNSSVAPVGIHTGAWLPRPKQFAGEFSRGLVSVSVNLGLKTPSLARSIISVARLHLKLCRRKTNSRNRRQLQHSQQPVYQDGTSSANHNCACMRSLLHLFSDVFSILDRAGCLDSMDAKNLSPL